MKNFSLKIVVTSFVFVVGFAFGLLIFQSSSADPAGVQMIQPPKLETVEWPVNKNGQTFGRGVGVSNKPDLIRAYGIDGNIGYVLEKDLLGELPKSPEEAVAMMKERERSPNTSRYIPLYESDGETVIGKFRKGNGGDVYYITEKK